MLGIAEGGLAIFLLQTFMVHHPLFASTWWPFFMLSCVSPARPGLGIAWERQLQV